MASTNPFGRNIPKLQANNIDGSTKQWFAQQLLKDPKKIDYYSTKSGLDKKLLSKWKKKEERGETFHKKGGGVRLCNKEEAAAVIRECTVAVKKQNGFTPGGTRELWSKAVKTSQKLLGKHHDGAICAQTVRNYNKEYELDKKQGSIRTDARLEAEFDLRNALSTIIMWSAVLALVNRLCCFLNYDAT